MRAGTSKSHPCHSRGCFELHLGGAAPKRPAYPKPAATPTRAAMLWDSGRRRCRVMATLGELLFYIATQQRDGGYPRVQGATTVWGIGPATLSAVARVLRPGEDEIAQHYAVKVLPCPGEGRGGLPGTKLGAVRCAMAPGCLWGSGWA